MGKYKFKSTGLKYSEKKEGKKRFKQYKEAYPHLQKYSDLQLLEELVVLELYRDRYKEQIAELKNKKGSEIIPEDLQDSLERNLKDLLRLKKELGLSEKKETLDAYRNLQELHEKFKLWRRKNQGSRKVNCPFCKKPFFLMIRTKNYKAIKPSCFQDKLLVNHKALELLKKGKITKKECADLHGTPVDYITYLQEKFQD